jgi:site-specific recombinase XerD
MNKLKSFLANDIEAFISFRKKLGYRDKPHKMRSFFSAIDHYLNKKDADWNDLTPAFFLGFRSQLSLEPQSINLIMGALRVFFDYLMRVDRINQNPLKDIENLKRNAFIPYIFSNEQVDNLLHAIQKKIRSRNESFFLTDLAVFTIISLIARCGLRTSEPLKLIDAHYKNDESTIYIEQSKFNKDRLIPVPQAVGSLINNFMSIRNSILHKEKFDYLFTSTHGEIKSHYIYKKFNAALQNLDIDCSLKKFAGITFGNPTPQSLRHSFAVNTLKNASAKGKNPENVLPVLAAYMGHTDYKYTALYLKVIDAEHRNAWVDFYSYKQNKKGQEI